MAFFSAVFFVQSQRLKNYLKFRGKKGSKMKLNGNNAERNEKEKNDENSVIVTRS